MRWVLAAVFLVACAEAAAPDASVQDGGADASVPELPYLTDDEGRAVILRGTNVSGDSKDPPDFMPDDYETQADFMRLRDELGMNAIRFLIFWEAIEPEEGTYDADYLARVRARVDAAIAAGLFVVVDMHQDVFGRGFGFDGAPRWACDEALYASFDLDRPSEWYLGYTRPEVMQCFDRFYVEHRGAFAAAWAEVARALRGAGVFAYEILNEPHWGSMQVLVFERTVLPAFYAEVIEAIRAEDPAPYVLVEPTSAANIGLGTALIPPPAERLVFAPHVYPPGLEQGTGWTGDRGLLDGWLADLRADALAMGLPLLVTELGARPQIEGATRYLGEVYGALDEARLGALQWDGGRGSYGIWNEDGTLSSVGAAIARPHPSRTAGVPIGWSWDGARFEYAWRELDAAGETEITFPSSVFGDPVSVALEDGGEAHVDGSIVRVPAIGGERVLVLE